MALFQFVNQAGLHKWDIALTGYAGYWELASHTHSLSLTIVKKLQNYIKDACDCLIDSAEKECYFDEPTTGMNINHQIECSVLMM